MTRSDYLSCDLQESSLAHDYLSSTQLLLAEGIQSNMLMENSELDVPEEEKRHVGVGFTLFR